MSKKTLWTIVLLVGGYLVCQAVADIGATKMVQIGSVVIPAGTFVFTITFTLRDMIHKRLGKQWARAVIIVAGVFNILMAGYLALMAALPSPPWFELGEAWGAIFGIVPAIVIGSIVAEVASELVDTEVYHRIRTWPQWSRVVISNAISLPLDSLIFATLAFVVLPPLFGQPGMGMGAALALTGGQIVWKGIVTVISIPGIYLVKENPLDELTLKRSETWPGAI